MLLEQIQFVAGVIGAGMTLLFLLSVIIKRNDIADIAWGVGIFVVALLSFATGPQNLFTTVLTIVAGLWGGRLFLRILLRNLKKGEDPRYKKWRDSWGAWFYPRSFAQIYLLQGFLMIVVGYSFIHASVYGDVAEFGVLQYLGIAVWLIGYIFEVVGDWQLDRFLAQPKNRGRVMQSGLWRYSRHPNYFGEVTMWWGIWLMVASLPLGFVALVSPLMITFLILKVSGVPMLEKLFANNPEFQEYKKRTSVFIPLPPKKVSL